MNQLSSNTMTKLFAIGVAITAWLIYKYLTNKPDAYAEPTEQTPAQVTTGTSIDLEKILPLLQSIGQHVPSLNQAKQQQISDIIQAMQHDTEKIWDLHVKRNSITSPLTIFAFKEDICSVGIEFTSCQEIIDIVDQAIDHITAGD